MVPPRQKRKSRTRNPPKKTKEMALEEIKVRKLHPEKHFDSTPKSHPFIKVCTAKKYMPLLRKHFFRNESIVREFYATTRVNEEPSMEFRDMDLTFDVETIRKYLHCPSVPKCQYQAFRADPSSYSWSDILEYLAIPGAEWHKRGNRHYLLRKEMKDITRVWLNFMCSSVRPRAHMSSSSMDDALLLYCLMHKEYPVDIAEIAYEAIVSCAKSDTANLVFPHLISEMCTREGVPSADDDTMFSTVHARSYSTMTAQPASSRKRHRRGSGSEEEEGADDENDLGSKMDQILTKLEEVQLNQQGFQLAQQEERSRRILIEQMLARIADRLDVPGLPDFPFTEGPGQTSGAKGQGGGDTSEEEEEEEENEEGEEEGQERDPEEADEGSAEDTRSSYDESSADDNTLEEYRTKSRHDKPTD